MMHDDFRESVKSDPLRENVKIIYMNVWGCMRSYENPLRESVKMMYSE